MIDILGKGLASIESKLIVFRGWRKPVEGSRLGFKGHRHRRFPQEKNHRNNHGGLAGQECPAHGHQLGCPCSNLPIEHGGNHVKY